MFKKITRAKAIPAKRPESEPELELGFTESEAVHCATELLGADNMFLSFLNIKGNYHLRAKLGNVDNAACRKVRQDLLLAMMVPASGWHCNTWLDALPVHI